MTTTKKIKRKPDETALPARPLVRHQPESEVGMLLKLAVEKDLDVEKLSKLVDLKERMEDRAAAAEFARAMAAFQAACPPVAKRSKASIVTKGGTRYSYSYAELDEIARTVAPILSANGLTYTWDSQADGGALSCTCTLRHVAGHTVTASFKAPTESSSAMSGVQKVAAALTFARRQSLVQVLGLTTTDPDTDGTENTGETITDEQANDLNDQLIELGGDARTRFLSYMGVEALAAIPANEWGRATTALEQKRKAVQA